MKQKVAVAALVLTLSSTRFANAETTAQTLSKARTHYATIERNLQNYTRLQSDLPNDSVEGGNLTAYFARGVARKIVARLYGETGFVVHESYFWNGQLFFVLRTESRYDKPIWLAAEDNTQIGKVVKRTQNRFYFRNGKLTRWIDEKHHARRDDAQFQLQQTQTLNIARKYLAKANALLD